MSKFVDECRREWKRLGVPHAVAAEMAADLEADLQEAESEGASVEEVLGSGAFDPRSFAASWAAERGVIPPPSPDRGRVPSRSFMRAAIVVLALITATGAVLVISSHPAEHVVPIPPFRAVACRATYSSPPPNVHRVTAKGGEVPYPGPFGPVPFGGAPPGVCHAVPAGPPPFASFAEISGVSWYSVGWTLLIVGILGIIFWLLSWWVWVGPTHRSSRATNTHRAGASLDSF